MLRQNIRRLSLNPAQMGQQWQRKHKMDWYKNPAYLKKQYKRAAMTVDPPKDEWAIPDHPKDVRREEIIEDHFHRKKHIRQPEDAPIYDEERFASFKLAIGSVHRRIGPDRVEIVIKDAVYQEFTSGFKPEKGLIVVQDHGQTRIGDFIVAKLVDKDNRVWSHKYMRTIRVKGNAICPFTGMRIRQNRLVDDDPLTVDEAHQMYDQMAEGRVNNYKFRDDFNRDRTYYELKWKPQDIAKAIKDGQEVKHENATKKLNPMEARRQRLKKINQAIKINSV